MYKTFDRLQKLANLPLMTGFYLTELGEARGKQELFTRQAPQKLKVLKEHALVESAVSSNRIEGVEIEGKRVGTVIFGKSLLHNRDEEEIRGYRNALEVIHENNKKLKLDTDLILKLHKLCRGDIWDAGEYKEKDVDIIETLPEGGSRIRFKTLAAAETPQALENLVNVWNENLKQRQIPPLLALAAFNLDFLCIHPFRDGNGRVSRLLLLLTLYQCGYEAGRFISLEKLIEENKERYYETLEICSQGWHENKHDPWPYINFLLWIIKEATSEFERRVDSLQTEKGAKTQCVLNAIQSFEGTFTVADIQSKCTAAGIDWIRKILKKERTAGRIECLGRGQQARWRKTVK